MKTEHLLIIRFSAMGDVAMTVPVVYSLARQYPDLRITMLSRGFARPFFENLAPNVSFMEADIKNEYRGIKGLNALYRRLAAKKFTAVADFHSVLRSDYLRMRFKLDRYRVAHIDKHRAAKRRLTADGDKKLVQLPTSFHNYADVLARLGYPVKLEFESLFAPDGSSLPPLPDKIGEKPHDGKWIGIAPFAAHEGKIYPVRLMEKVVQMLAERHPGCRIFFFGGGKHETAVFSEWCGKYKECTNASGIAGGLAGELALMNRLDVMISMDSANMHLASLAGTTVVSVWGATHPYAGFMGWGQSIDNAVQIDLPCRPCSIYGNKPCMRGDFFCMKNIAPEQIVERTEAVMNGKAARKISESRKS